MRHSLATGRAASGATPRLCPRATSDNSPSSVSPNGAIQSQWELFAEFLEKGVIRRARLQSLFVPRENDVQLVAECCQAIEHRPLPLTA